MTISDAQKKASIRYKAKHYKRIPLDVVHSKYDEIKAAALQSNQSVNGYIKQAIDERLQRDFKEKSD